MESKPFNPGDSIKTIESALRQAKTEKTGAPFYYLLWGIILFVHFLLLFTIAEYPDIRGGLIETLIYIVFPVGGFISYFRSKKDTKNEKALSYFERVYLFGFGGFALAYGTVFLSSVFFKSNLSVSLYPLLLGFTVFVTGGITKHVPSIVCGIIGIVITGISLNSSLAIQYLLAAMASIIVCMIPGYLMKNRNV